jgi:hypothetical protein
MAAAAPAIQNVTTAGSPFDLGPEKTGWISQATFESLPERFREGALELARRGEIVIENMPGQPAGTRENHDKHVISQ